MRDLNFREIDYICKSRCFHAHFATARVVTDVASGEKSASPTPRRKQRGKVNAMKASRSWTLRIFPVFFRRRRRCEITCENVFEILQFLDNDEKIGSCKGSEGILYWLSLSLSLSLSFS